MIKFSSFFYQASSRNNITFIYFILLFRWRGKLALYKTYLPFAFVNWWDHHLCNWIYNFRHPESLSVCLDRHQEWSLHWAYYQLLFYEICYQFLEDCWVMILVNEWQNWQLFTNIYFLGLINSCLLSYLQAKLCVVENIPVIPIPGPSALLAALSASGLLTNEFTFGNTYRIP